jgi:hypothetical protein
MKNKKSTKAVAPAAKRNRFVKGKRIRGFKTFQRNGEAMSVIDSTAGAFVAQSRCLTVMGDEPAELLNKIVDASNGSKPAQVAIYRVPPFTQIKGNAIVCPKGHQPKLVGLTNTQARWQSRKQNEHDAKQDRRAARRARSKARREQRKANTPLAVRQSRRERRKLRRLARLERRRLEAENRNAKFGISLLAASQRTKPVKAIKRSRLAKRASKRKQRKQRA